MPSSQRDDESRKVLFVYRAWLLAIGFFMLFIAYSSGQILQTSINPAGYECLATLYGTFAAGALVAPYLIQFIRPKILIPISAIPYVLFVASNMLGAKEPTFLIFACGLNGFAAATLWSAQGLYLSQCAVARSKLTGEALTDCNTLMNSSFYTIFASSGAVSFLTTGIVLITSPSIGDAIFPLFFGLTFVALSGTLLLSIIAEPTDAGSRIFGQLFCFAKAPPKVQLEPQQSELSTRALVNPDPSGSSSKLEIVSPPVKKQAPTLFFMIRFLTTNLRMGLMAAPILAFGMTMGLYNGAWMGVVVSQQVGKQYVGFVGFCYSVFCTASTYGWGKIIPIKSFGRRWAFVVATSVQILFFLSSAVFLWNQQSLKTHSLEANLAFLFIAAMVYGSADSIWYTQLPATLQTFFYEGPEQSCANAAVRFYTALGFTIQSIISYSLDGYYVIEQMIFIVVVLLFSGSCLAYLHFRVCSVDFRQSMKTQTSENVPVQEDVEAIQKEEVQVEELVTEAPPPMNASTP
jgi:Ion channel regulatory protein UNC-93